MLWTVRVLLQCWPWFVWADCLGVEKSWLVYLGLSLLLEVFPSLLDALHVQGVQASLICLAASSELAGPIFMQVVAGVSSSGPVMLPNCLFLDVMGYHCHCYSLCLFSMPPPVLGGMLLLNGLLGYILWLLFYLTACWYTARKHSDTEGALRAPIDVVLLCC